MANLYRGVLKAYTPGSWVATVMLAGAIQQNVTSLPVSRAIAEADMVVGRNVAVLAFDETNPRDGVIVAVYT